MIGCGADEIANSLDDSLSNDVDFNIPMPDFSSDIYKVPVPGTDGLYAQVPHLTNADLTTRVVDGAGTFDALMTAFKAHLKLEFEQNRITGAEYTKAYIALVEGAMSNATQFLMGRELTYWQAIGAQIAAQNGQVALVTARIQAEIEKTKLHLVRIEAQNQQANYALTKLRLAGESVNYCTAKYNLEEMMPQQKALLLAQVERAAVELIGAETQNELAEKQVSLAQNEIDLGPDKLALLAAQVAQEVAQTANITKQGILLEDEHAQRALKDSLLAAQVENTENQAAQVIKQTEAIQKEIDLADDKQELLLRQIANQEAQTSNVTKQGILIDDEHALQSLKQELMEEQIETARAQTLDTRSDGAVVSGSVGQQKALYEQQITSYQRDAELKAARIFSDAWITMKTIDEGLSPPSAFSNLNLDDILGTIKTNNNI